MIRRLALLVCAVLSLAAGGARAGAWLPAPGAGVVILELLHSEADRAFGAGGGLRRAPQVTKTELSAYAEWGIAEGWAAIAQGTLQRKEIGGPRPDDRAGPDYTMLGLRARLAQGAWGVVSAEGAVRLPGADDASAPAQIGATDLEADARLLLGRDIAVAGRPGWAELQATFRHRAGAPADELRLDATLGLRPAPRWMVMAQSFGAVSVGAAEGGFPESDSLKLRLSAARELPGGWTVQAGALATVAGRLTTRELGGFLALWRRF